MEQIVEAGQGPGNPADFPSDAIPLAAVEAVCTAIQPAIDVLVRKFCDEAYDAILGNVQEYLRENAEWNIKSRFDAQQRSIILAYSALAAVEDSRDLQEAKANAYAARKGYWSRERAAEYRDAAIAKATVRQARDASAVA